MRALLRRGPRKVDTVLRVADLDEEASNLLLYQRAYQAAAQAISTVDQMMQTVIQMGGAGT